MSNRGHTVSPFRPDFMSFIEPKMRPIITTLINKNYLPFACCEGHNPSSKVFFTVAFSSRQDAQSFAMNFEKFNIQEVQEKTMLNYRTRPDGKIEGITEFKKTKDELVRFLNYEFMRNYDEYFLVEIIVQDWDFKKYNMSRFLEYHFGGLDAKLKNHLNIVEGLDVLDK